MKQYIYQKKDWPLFIWDEQGLSGVLAKVRFKQGKLIGRMEGLGFNLQAEAQLQTLTQDVLKSSEIEGEHLNPEQVRSSIARRLGMGIAGLIPADRNVEGVVEMMLNASQKYQEVLDAERLFGWHAALFPTGRSGMYRIVVGAWRNNTTEDPMQVVSGAMGQEKVHFQAPDASTLEKEMTAFLNWFNTEQQVDPVIKAAIAHLWFVTIHPFDDGNGRIGRAIMDLQLSRADNTNQRFYSLSSQIKKERNKYYEMLEETQKGELDITPWIEWFLGCLDRAIDATDDLLQTVLKKAKFWEQYNSNPFNDRQKLMLNKLIDGFDGKLNSSKWAKIAKCSSDTALRDINLLLEQGILVKESAGGRSTGYLLAIK